MILEEGTRGIQRFQNDAKEYIQLPLLNRPSFFHFFGTRLLAEHSKTEAEHSQNITAMAGAESLGRCRQVHGDLIHKMGIGERESSSGLPSGDGLITDQCGLLVSVSTADCVPVMLYDPVRRAVSVLHAGWRGSHLNISAKAVSMMESDYGSNSKDLLAGIGPSIGPCCFEVGPDVWEKLERDASCREEVVVHKKEDKAWVDLVQLNRMQLIEAGLHAENIQDTGLCTACDPNLFYSFRRDRKKIGNMTSGLMLRPES